MVLNTLNDEKGIEILWTVAFIVLFSVHHEIVYARPDKCQSQRGEKSTEGNFQRFKGSTLTCFSPLKVGLDRELWMMLRGSVIFL